MRAYVLVAMVIGLFLTSCAAPPPERPGVAERTVNPSFVHGTDHGGIDRLAATVVSDAQRYWAQAYPAAFGGPWHDLDGGFFSVDTAGTGSSPPCSSSASEVEGNAYYCQSVDAIAWDRTALLPVLREHYGDAAVAVVLSHEIGHAVQQRADLTGGEPMHLEATADCFAGSFMRWVSDDRAPHLRANPDQLDDALRAITVFRDPVGSGDEHGTAFDRVSAFQAGFTGGPGGCPDLRPSSLTEPVEPDPNAALDAAMNTAGAERFFGELVTARGARWTAPRLGDCPNAPRPVSYCAAPPRVSTDREALEALRDGTGDQAVTTLVASRYAAAALAQLGRPVTGAAVNCLTGAYTAEQADLSPGDLDEAVQVTLSPDAIPLDSRRSGPTTAFDRFAAFRSGALGGSSACT
ncbi:peptidase [Saccharopolyspora griseoalba]|uniref:Peptidase n=1 Tax=Saccharopolyspora griseoalba TaxID=1431848 RepID=A0ABW2LJG7_9PSEU